MKRSTRDVVDVSQELSQLKYPPKQNNNLSKLPANITVHKRPINHAPVASKFAGSKVPKVVYISRRTPVMSAVKRVKQFLRQIEKRAIQSSGIDGLLDRAGSRRTATGAGDELQRKLEGVSEKLVQDAEQVLVKASGRAMEQALRIAEWFRKREGEVATKVEVRTGSVSVVDDLLEKGEEGEEGLAEEANFGTEIEDKDRENQTAMEIEEVGDTTMELLRNLEGKGGKTQGKEGQGDTTGYTEAVQGQQDVSEPTKRKRKRKRKEYDPDDVPEARIRWVKTIEVAISLKA